MVLQIDSTNFRLCCRCSLPDPASCEHAVSLIQHQCLTGCDAKLWFVELDSNAIFRNALDTSRRCRVLIANLCQTLEVVGNIVDQPTDAVCVEFMAGKIGISA